MKFEVDPSGGFKFEGSLKEWRATQHWMAGKPPSSFVVPSSSPVGFDPEPSAGWNDFRKMAAPVEESVPVDTQAVNLPKLSPDSRADAWAEWKQFCRAWVFNFEVEGTQPNRTALMQALGSGRLVVPILVMAYEMGSLQRLVEKALLEEGFSIPDLEYLDRVAGTMVQVSHAGFPDLAGTIDYTTRWRRIIPSYPRAHIDAKRY